MNVLTELPDHLEERMMNAEQALRTDLASYRTGKASVSLVENIMVDYYGTKSRLRDIAGLSTPEVRLIVIQPWDKTAFQAIEKAILASNIGISPVNDGKVIRLPVPELSEERRVSLTKQVKTRTEDSKVEIRNIRRDGNEIAKKAQKATEITEDQLADMLDQIQTLTDDYIKKMDAIAADKEKELMKI